MKDILTRIFTLLLVPLATVHAADDAPGKPASVFVPPPVASQARWERQMLHYGELHLKQMEKAIADPKADATIGAYFYDRVRLLYGMAEQQQLGQPRRVPDLTMFIGPAFA